MCVDLLCAGRPFSEFANKSKLRCLNKEQIKKMKHVCKVGSGTARTCLFTPVLRLLFLPSPVWHLTRVFTDCQLGREVLDACGAIIKPGITTDDIDRVCHEVRHTHTHARTHARTHTRTHTHARIHHVLCTAILCLSSRMSSTPLTPNTNAAMS